MQRSAEPAGQHPRGWTPPSERPQKQLSSMGPFHGVRGELNKVPQPS